MKASVTAGLLLLASGLGHANAYVIEPTSLAIQSGVSQVHSAVGKDPSTMATISWASTHAEDSHVVVTATPDGGASYSITAKATHTRYRHMLYHSPYLFTANVTGLYPDTLHTYKIQNDSRDAWSYYLHNAYQTWADESPSHRAVAADSGSFWTAPAVGTQPKAGPLKMVVFGDMGQTPNSQATVAGGLRHLPESHLILHAGDLSYADTVQPRWDSWFTMIEPLSRHIHWMATSGNHEIELNPATKMSFEAFEERMHMPEVKPAVRGKYPGPIDIGHYCPSAATLPYDWGNSFYAFRYGLAHVIVLNSYTDTAPTSPQYKWLVGELGRVDRDATPWLIMMYHSPWYNTNEAHQHEFNTVAMRANMEQLFIDHGVDLCINGHVHAYERSHPVAFNVTTPNAPVHIIIGDGGNREGHANNFIEQEDWVAFRNGDTFGGALIEIHNHTHMTWKWNPNDPNKTDHYVWNKA